jgi:hypothetical protein
MGKVVIIKLRVYLLRVVRKFLLILEVDLVRETWEANPNPIKMFSVTIVKKYGHYKSECPKLKNKGEGGSSSVTGVVEGNFEDSGFVLVVTGSNGRFSDQWVLDTACTFICPLKRIGLLPMSQPMVV